MKKNKYLFIFICIFILAFVLPFFNIIDIDLLWNYGFSSNIAKGLVMYKDFAMVITPLYPFINSIFLMIFGNNLVTFYLVNALMITTIIYLVFRLNKKAIIPIFLIIIFVGDPNYNLLCILWVFLLIYLEKKNKNDYIIGIVLGLCFLTKSNIGIFLCFPSLFTKDIQRILDRIVGFIIPNILIVIWFYFNKSLMNYINYAFLGLLDFANQNKLESKIFLILTLVICIYLTIKYVKNKDKTLLYILAFQIINYPLFNMYHFIYSMIPVAYYTLSNSKIFSQKIFQLIFAFLMIFPIGATIIKANIHNLEQSNYFKYKPIQHNINEKLTILDKELSKKEYDNKELYFITCRSYLYKIAYKLEINKYDLLIKGNMGYNGQDKMINSISKAKDNSIFIIETDNQLNQFDTKILEYVMDNYHFKKNIEDKFYIYTN